MNGNEGGGYSLIFEHQYHVSEICFVFLSVLVFMDTHVCVTVINVLTCYIFWISAMCHTISLPTIEGSGLQSVSLL